MNTIIFQNVSKNFRSNKKTIKVFSDLNLCFEKGKIYGIVGKNGVGKTTLLRLAGGIYHPNKGKIFVNGKTISLINLRSGLKNRLSLLDNAYFIGSLIGLKRKNVGANFEKIVSLAGLEDFRDMNLSYFSEGMKERFLLSLVFFSQWEILLLDEIFYFCDEEFRDKILELFKKDLSCKTILWASHDLDLLQKYCNLILEINEGTVFNCKF